MFARTPRLLLRPAWPEDARPLAAARAATTLDRDLPGDTLILLRTNGAPRLIGGIGLDAADHQLSYWIVRHYWGLGFATEAAAAMVAFAEEGLRLTRLKARHAADNPAAGRVLRKLGFRPAPAEGLGMVAYSRDCGAAEPRLAA